MYIIKRSSRFKKDFKKTCNRKGFNEKFFIAVIEDIRKGKALPARCKNHKLHGEFVGCMECHLHPDILLIYMLDWKNGVLYLLRIGTHSDLF